MQDFNWISSDFVPVLTSCGVGPGSSFEIFDTLRKCHKEQKMDEVSFLFIMEQTPLLGSLILQRCFMSLEDARSFLKNGNGSIPFSIVHGVAKCYRPSVTRGTSNV